MKISEEFTFDEWFEIFRSCVRGHGYKGRIDPDGIRSYYEEEQSPEEASEDFAKEMLD